MVPAHLPSNGAASSSRMRLLLLNTFELAEDSVTLDNVTDWITRLNATFPQQFAEISHKLKPCELTKELDDVRSSLLLSFIQPFRQFVVSHLWFLIELWSSHQTVFNAETSTLFYRVLPSLDLEAAAETPAFVPVGHFGLKCYQNQNNIN